MGENPNTLNFLSTILMLAGFVVFWIITMSFSSLLSGWKALTGVYAIQHPFSGRQFRFQTARMRWRMEYGMCLTVGANAQGLFLSITFPFWTGHPNLFIPWEDVSSKPKQFWWSIGLELRFRQCPEIPFLISSSLVDKLVDAADGGFVIEQRNW